MDGLQHVMRVCKDGGTIIIIIIKGHSLRRACLQKASELLIYRYSTTHLVVVAHVCRVAD